MERWGIIPRGTSVDSYLNLIPRKLSCATSIRISSDQYQHSRAFIIVAWGRTTFASLNFATWTIFPNIPLLRLFIAMEEARYLVRENAIANGQPDPGRLSYEKSYGLYGGVTTFNVFAKEGSDQIIPRMNIDGTNGKLYRLYWTEEAKDLPPFLPIELIVSPTIVIYMRQSWFLKCIFSPGPIASITDDPAVSNDHVVIVAPG